ncbi:HMCN protein, partial [Biomphalaria glabrata]
PHSVIVALGTATSQPRQRRENIHNESEYHLFLKSDRFCLDVMVKIFTSPTSFKMSWLLLATVCFLSVQMSQSDDNQKRMSTLGKWHMFALPKLFSSEKIVEMIILTNGPFPVKCTYQVLEQGSTVDPLRIDLANKNNIIDISTYSKSEAISVPSINVTTSVDSSVLLYVAQISSLTALVKLLPVQYWGKEYYAVSLLNSPMILITPSELNTTVVITLLSNYNIENRTASTKEDTYTLDNFMTHSISICEVEEATSFTGTHIVADKKVGVISGSCFSRELRVGCEKDNVAIADVGLENILPVEYFGLEFMTFTPTNNETSKKSNIVGEVIVVASRSNTKVTFMSGSSSNVSNLDVAGNSTRILNLEPQVIKSNFPVMATYAMYGSCEANLGAPSLTVLIPTFLYSTFYEISIRNPMEEGWSFVVIFKGTADSLFETNLGQVKAQDVQGVRGQTSWSSGFIPIENSSFVYMPGSPAFGCYVQYVKSNTGAITYVDVLNSTDEKTTPAPKVLTTVVTLPPVQTTAQPKITTAQPVMTTGGCTISLLIIPGDNIDNDCDGAVDEELANGKDDDGDGKVDEDLAQLI